MELVNTLFLTIIILDLILMKTLSTFSIRPSALPARPVIEKIKVVLSP